MASNHDGEGLPKGEVDTVALVSPLIGEGAEAHRLVRVGAWEFTVWGSAPDEARMLDLDLGGRLGCSRKDEARELVKRMLADGRLNDSEVLRRPRETTARGGRPGVEYWLTEEQALLVATQSGTAQAWALTREMTRVYRLAQRGLLPSQRVAPAIDLAGLAREVVKLLAAERTTDGGAVGTAGARETKAKLGVYADTMADDKKGRRSWRSSGEMELREHLGFFGTAKRWEALPFSLFQEARTYLEKMIKRAEKMAAERRQGQFWPPPPAPPADGGVH